MKTVVIAGSARLEMEVQKWKRHWEEKQDVVLDYPRPIPSDRFLEKYPSVFEKFFDHLAQADVVFVMNEPKNGIPGYIGPETFAELAYAVYLRMKTRRRPEILVLSRPQPEMRGSEEVFLWEKLGMLKFI